MAGRKPKPTRLKVVGGNPGHRPLNKNEPKPKIATARAPHGLSKLAHKHWHSIATLLTDAQILTELDKPALVLYCEAWARWREALEKLNEHGLVINAPGGYPIQNPYLPIANKAFDHMQKMMTEFGMTPSSRSRIQIQETEVEDPLAAFLNKKK